MGEDIEVQTARARRRRVRETENLFSRLPATYAASRKQGQRILKRAGGLSIVEWRTLWDLVEAGPLSIRELAEIQRTDHSLISRALPAIRRKGLVEMQRDKSDGRQTIVTLTADGRKAYEEAAPYMKARRDMLATLFTPAESREFLSYLDRLDSFLQQPIDEWLEPSGATK